MQQITIIVEHNGEGNGDGDDGGESDDDRLIPAFGLELFIFSIGVIIYISKWKKS